MKTGSIEIMVFKSDFENFKKNLHKKYEDIFENVKFKDRITFNEYKTNIKYVPFEAQEANISCYDKNMVIEKENAELLKITLKDVSFHDRLEFVTEIDVFLELLDYYELLNNYSDGSAVYYADFYTKNVIHDKFKVTPLINYKLEPMFKRSVTYEHI